ncbi:hypothetical protein ACIP01_11695 [Pseudomonas monteilii]|uniref:hypothetical protein n=1 Tax=Pseudomonas monteilii TaxID=76759 RepID=UPI0038297B2F
MTAVDLNRSFTATLECLTTPELKSLSCDADMSAFLHRPNMNNEADAKECMGSFKSTIPVTVLDHVIEDIADSGWLCLEAKLFRAYLRQLTATLRFDFIEQRGNRRHYRVSCATPGADYNGRHLDSSRGGFLGFYKSVADDVFWKIEEIGVHDVDGDERPTFLLRDRWGHVVNISMRSMKGDWFGYLCTQGTRTTQLHFTLSNYQPL